jgi:hypothetical protein
MTRNRELVDALSRNQERTARLMYMELRSSRFRTRNFGCTTAESSMRCGQETPKLCGKQFLIDIVEAQSATLTLGGQVSPLPILDGARTA